MPTANFSRINLDMLYPPFRDRLLEVVARCEARGASYVATNGYRSFVEQDRLFTIGRTVPGNRITNAKGGESQHQYGLAVDFVRDADPKTPGVQADWSDPAYDVLIEELGKAGLHSGVSYKDKPHAGWHDYFRLPEIGDLRGVYNLSSGDVLTRLQRVWEYVTAHSASLADYPKD